MSKIIFLGTAGDSTVVSRQLRASGGIVLQLEGVQFHIDPGPGALVRAKEYGVNPHQTTAVLVSHHHINHCSDLNAMVEAMTHGGIEHRGLVLASKSVLSPQEDIFPILTKHHQALVEKIIPVEKNHKVGIEFVEIHTLAADHTDPTAVGFKFFCPRFTVSYTGDTAYSDLLVEQLQGTDILILNVPYPGSTGKNKHLDVEAATRIILGVHPHIAILTHFGWEMLKNDPLAISRDVQRLTGIPTIAATDGFSLSPENYRFPRSPVLGY